MVLVSVRYRFSQSFGVSAPTAYRWCTDFGPEDGPLFSERTRRSIRRLSGDALVMTDVTFPSAGPRRIRRLVRIDPAHMAWTNTHLDGPFRYSQFWYRIVADGPNKSHLRFVGLKLENSLRPLTRSETARRSVSNKRSDSGEWRRRLAPALERDCQARGAD